MSVNKRTLGTDGFSFKKVSMFDEVISIEFYFKSLEALLTIMFIFNLDSSVISWTGNGTGWRILTVGYFSSF